MVRFAYSCVLGYRRERSWRRSRADRQPPAYNDALARRRSCSRRRGSADSRTAAKAVPTHRCARQSRHPPSLSAACPIRGTGPVLPSWALFPFDRPPADVSAIEASGPVDPSNRCVGTAVRFAYGLAASRHRQDATAGGEQPLALAHRRGMEHLHVLDGRRRLEPADLRAFAVLAGIAI